MLQATPQSPPEGQRGNRPVSRRLRYGVGFAVLLALVGYLLVRHIAATYPEGCEVRGGGRSLHLGMDQAANASTIAAVAASRGMSERAVTIALATSLQESRLRNISHGDRDSVGLFQQRPSQGWGTPRQIRDTVYATNEFYDALEDVPGYSRLPLTVAAQKVQKSGFPQAYAKHEADASLLSAALTGREAGALNCVTGAETKPAPGDPEALGGRVAREFGGFAGTFERKDRTLRFQTDRSGGRRGQHEAALAAWAVAHAAELNIAEVSRGGRVWTAARSSEGWRTGSSSRPGTVLITVF